MLWADIMNQSLSKALNNNKLIPVVLCQAPKYNPLTSPIEGKLTLASAGMFAFYGIAFTEIDDPDAFCLGIIFQIIHSIPLLFLNGSIRPGDTKMFFLVGIFSFSGSHYWKAYSGKPRNRILYCRGEEQPDTPWEKYFRRFGIFAVMCGWLSFYI